VPIRISALFFGCSLALGNIVFKATSSFIDIDLKKKRDSVDEFVSKDRYPIDILCFYHQIQARNQLTFYFFIGQKNQQ